MATGCHLFGFSERDLRSNLNDACFSAPVCNGDFTSTVGVEALTWIYEQVGRFNNLKSFQCFLAVFKGLEARFLDCRGATLFRVAGGGFGVDFAEVGIVFEVVPLVLWRRESCITS